MNPQLSAPQWLCDLPPRDSRFRPFFPIFPTFPVFCRSRLSATGSVFRVPCSVFPVPCSAVAVPWSLVPGPWPLSFPYSQVPSPRRCPGEARLCRGEAWPLVPICCLLARARIARPPYFPPAFTYARANAFPKPHPGRQASPAAGDKNLTKSTFPRPERSPLRAQTLSHHGAERGTALVPRSSGRGLEDRPRSW